MEDVNPSTLHNQHYSWWLVRYRKTTRFKDSLLYQPNGQRRLRRRLLSWCSAAISLSAAVLLGPQITTLAPVRQQASLRLLCSAWSKYPEMLQINFSDAPTPPSVATQSPSIIQIFVILHTYCLSSLALHRCRKEDVRQNQILATSISACAGASFYTVSGGTWADFMMVLLLTLPLAISLALVISVVFHVIAKGFKGAHDDVLGDLSGKPEAFNDSRTQLRKSHLFSFLRN
ncbi:hypothetical protein F5X96DRAFT_655496 [Biscogniauxia mediterranea]|nr:hypothetical protein F5X96DRAFT_655496 [Biscogniauxia mediterranea]